MTYWAIIERRVYQRCIPPVTKWHKEDEHSNGIFPSLQFINTHKHTLTHTKKWVAWENIFALNPHLHQCAFHSFLPSLTTRCNRVLLHHANTVTYEHYRGGEKINDLPLQEGVSCEAPIEMHTTVCMCRDATPCTGLVSPAAVFWKQEIPAPKPFQQPNATERACVCVRAGEVTVTKRTGSSHRSYPERCWGWCRKPRAFRTGLQHSRKGAQVAPQDTFEWHGPGVPVVGRQKRSVRDRHWWRLNGSPWDQLTDRRQWTKRLVHAEG